MTAPNDDVQGLHAQDDKKDEAGSKQIVSDESMTQSHSASSLDSLDHASQLSAIQSADNPQLPDPFPNTPVNTIRHP